MRDWLLRAGVFVEGKVQTAFAVFYLVVTSTVPTAKDGCFEGGPDLEPCRALWAKREAPIGAVARTGEGVEVVSDIRVVATGSGGRLLVARMNGAEAVVLELRDGEGKVLDSLVQRTPWASAGKDLPQLASVRDFVSRHKMSFVVGGEVDPAGRYLVAIEYGKGVTEAVLIGAVGRESLWKWKSNEIVVRVYWSRDGAQVFAAGHEGGREFLLGAGVEAKAARMDVKELHERLVSQARHHISNRRYLRASRMAGEAIRLRSSPEALHAKCVADAWLRRYEESARALGELRATKGETTKELVESAWRQSLVREAFFSTLDFSAEDFKYSASKGFEGTSVWVKIKDANGTTIGIFKPTNGNTYHRGEVFTYQMSKLLGTEHMYPVTTLLELDKAGCKKFSDALTGVKYKGMKERNRKKLIAHCQKHGKLEGAFKEWVSGFVFLSAIGTRDKLKSHSIYRYLSKKSPKPSKEKMVKAKVITSLYKPDHCKEATYHGRLNEAKFARDLSDMMVMDALNGNEDRFPGANIEFKTLGHVREIKKCTYDFGESGLFSLDNGATFKGTGSNGMQDLTKGMSVSRFHRRTVERLKAMQSFISGTEAAPKFLRRHGIRTVGELWKFLALDKGDSHKRRKEPHKLFESTLRAVLRHIDSVADKRSWF